MHNLSHILNRNPARTDGVCGAHFVVSRLCTDLWAQPKTNFLSTHKCSRQVPSHWPISAQRLLFFLFQIWMFSSLTPMLGVALPVSSHHQHGHWVQSSCSDLKIHILLCAGSPGWANHTLMPHITAPWLYSLRFWQGCARVKDSVNG